MPRASSHHRALVTTQPNLVAWSMEENVRRAVNAAPKVALAALEGAARDGSAAATVTIGVSAWAGFFIGGTSAISTLWAFPLTAVPFALSGTAAGAVLGAAAAPITGAAGAVFGAVSGGLSAAKESFQKDAKKS